MLHRSVLLAAAASMALPGAAHGQSGGLRYVGDPVTYLVQGRPATALTTVFRVSVPLATEAQMTVRTSGGDVLGSSAPAAFGSSGLCYRASFRLSSAVSNGGTVQVLLGSGDVSLQPNPELVRLYTPRRVRSPATLIGGNC